MKSKSALRAAILAGSIAALLAGHSALAVTYTWTSTTTGARDWTTATNWLGSNQYVSGSANELMFFADSTTNIAAMTQTFTNVPAALSMNTLTLNGKGASSGASSSTITVGTGSTWTIGDGTTSTVNLNANFGATAAAGFNTIVAANLTLNQTTTLFTGTGTGGFTFSGNITDGVNDYGITKSGSSTLVLSGTNNTYSGTTTLSAGVLQGNMAASATPVSSFGTSALQLNGGTLNLRSNGAGSNGTITVGNNTTVGGNTTINVAQASANTGNTIALGTLSIGANTLGVTGANTYALSFGVTTLTGNAIFDATTANLSITGAIDDGVSSFGFTKTGAGTLTLSGTNTYGGVTTVNAGTLVITKEVSLASNTAANLNVKSGATLQLNVDSAGTAGFTVANLDTLLGNILVANTAAQGLQSGATISIDTSTATGATFTQGNLIANSTGAFGGVIALTKLGAGTLVLNQTNTYTGNTTITAGILNANTSAALGGASNTLVFNGGTLQAGGTITSLSTRAVNMIGAGTIDTNGNAVGIAGSIYGTGALTKIGAGTLTLSGPSYFSGNITVSAGTIATTNALALRNNAYNTTGSNGTTIGLDVTSGLNSGSLTLGGLAGSVDLASAFTAGFTGTVTNLILNPQSGATPSYGGVIDNGSMSLTKTGAGTQTLTGANLYTGATTINSGTLNLGGATATGSLASTVLNLGGGTFSYTRTGTNAQTFTTTNTTAGANSVTASLSTQTINMGGIAGRSVGSTLDVGSTGTITTTTANDATGILGGWATITSNNWAVSSGSGLDITGSVTYYTTSTGLNVAANYAAKNIDIDSSPTIVGNINANTIRFNSASRVLTLAAGDNIFAAGGILVNSGFTGTINGGNLLGSSDGDLIVHAYGNLSIGSLIKNNGGATALTKSGGGQLTLTNNSNSYSGGTFLNGGTLVITNDGQLGVGGGITVNGTVTINGGDQYSLARTLTLNEGASLTSNNGFGVTGVFSGNGALSVTSADDHNFTNAANTYTGAITSATAASPTYGLTFASIGDTAGAGLITLVGGSGTFRWTSASGSTTTLANRQFAISGTGSGMISARGTTAASNLVINKDLLLTGAVGAKTLTLGGTNTGNNTFAGRIADGTDGGVSVVSLTKAEASTWVLSNANTYTGATTVSAGRLSLNNLNAIATTSSVTVASGGTLGFPIAGTYNIPGTINIAGIGATLPGGNGALWFGQGGSYASTLNAPINMTAAATIGSFGVIMNQTLGGSIGGTGPLTISSQGGMLPTPQPGISTQRALTRATPFSPPPAECLI